MGRREFRDSAIVRARKYPQTWYLLDVVGREPRLVGHEVVDLSPGAIELRAVARALREHGEPNDRWVAVRDEPILDRLDDRYLKRLSFGPEVAYCVEHDASREVHEGRPLRHLAVRFASRVLTPATAAEIGLYFYGRRPATFAFTNATEVHGYIGMEWEPLAAEDLDALLSREIG